MIKSINKRRFFWLLFFAIIIGIIVFFISKTYCPELRKDTDIGNYSSSRGYMAYYNQNLTALNPFENTINVYSGNSKFGCGNPIDINDYSSQFYLVDGKLFYRNNVDSDCQISNKDITRYKVYGNNVIYSTSGDCVLYIFCLDTNSTTKIENYDIGKIRWFDVDENNVYIAYVCDLNSITQSISIIGCNYKLNKKIVEVNFETDKQIAFFLCNGEVIYNIYGASDNTIYQMDFKNKVGKELFKAYNVENMVCNNRYIFYNIHNYVTSFYKQTTSDETNGLWKYDISSGLQTKISNECIIDDLLVTENYLYCYKVNYIFWYGMLDGINLGKKIEQISIN